jgi:hypothetical protein
MRENDKGDPEVWTNLGDILTWLDELPRWTGHRVAADVAAEIRQMLYDSVVRADEH